MSTTSSSPTDEGPSSMPGSQGPLPRDDMFELLSNERRRYTLYHLRQHGEAVELGDLVEQVAAWETSTPLQQVSAADRKRVYTSLQQFHLPKMDEKGVVEFDHRAGTIDISDRASDLDIYLEVVDGRDIPWSQYYLGLSGVTLALSVAGAASLLGLPSLPDAGLAIFTATAFLLSAAVHAYVTETEMSLDGGGPPPGADASADTD